MRLKRSGKVREDDLVDALERLVRANKGRARGVIVGIGDDAAVVRPGSGDFLMTTDVMVEGRHFRREWFTGRELGWRLAAVNLSDIAAMGGRPLYGLLSLAIPDDVPIEFTTDIERGVQEHLVRYGATIVGGNLSGIEGTLVCDLTLVGSVGKGKAWRRRCLPGDAIVLAGSLGEAAGGLHAVHAAGSDPRLRRLVQAYKKPHPLLDVAEVMKREKGVHGVIDVSDGFSTDLIRMCRASRAGCDVDVQRIPVSKTLVTFCDNLASAALQLALHGGDDYALIASVDAKRAEALVDAIRTKTGVPATRVGYFTNKKGRYTLVDDHGRKSALVASGWDHFTGRR
jgi:thiamine-monophosphate kinase